MHSAPSVSYPVGRLRFHAAGLLVISLAGLTAGLLWRQQAQPPTWQQILFIVIWLGSSGAAWRSWSRSPCGILHWNGQLWHWDVGASSAIGQVTVQLDLQRYLLLRLRTARGQVTWLWLGRSGDTIRWDALRRAAFSDAPDRLSSASAPVDHGVS